MSEFFSLDGPVWNFLGKVTNIILLSLVFIVTCLPIVTIGAAITALYSQMFLIAKDMEGHVMISYFKEFAAAFKEATLMWVIVVFLGAFLAGDLYILTAMHMPLAGLFMPVLVILTVLLLVFTLYYFPLLARCETNRKNLIILCLVMPVREWWRTIFLIFILAIMFAVGVFVTAPFLVVAPGVVSFSHVFLFEDILKKYNLKAVGENVEE